MTEKAGQWYWRCVTNTWSPLPARKVRRFKKIGERITFVPKGKPLKQVQVGKR